MLVSICGRFTRVKIIKHGGFELVVCFLSQAGNIYRADYPRIFYSVVSCNNTKNCAVGHVFRESRGRTSEVSGKSCWHRRGIDGNDGRRARSSHKNGADSSPQGAPLLSSLLLSPLSVHTSPPVLFTKFTQGFSSFVKPVQKESRQEEIERNSFVQFVSLWKRKNYLIPDVWNGEERNRDSRWNFATSWESLSTVPSYSSFIRLVSFYYAGKYISTWIFFFSPPPYIIDEWTQARNTDTHTLVSFMNLARVYTLAFYSHNRIYRTNGSPAPVVNLR